MIPVYLASFDNSLITGVSSHPLPNYDNYTYVVSATICLYINGIRYGLHNFAIIRHKKSFN